MELLPGARFRISPEPGSESRWGRGHRLGGERSPGSPTIRVVHSFSLLSFQPGRASALSLSSLSSLSTTRGILEKKISIFPKQATPLLKSQYFVQFLF